MFTSLLKIIFPLFFHLAAFKVFYLSLLFSHLIMMCLDMVFFVFILLEILKTFGNMSLNFSLNLENFVIIFSNVYSTPLLSFWISNGMHIFLSPIGHLLFSHSVMSNSFQSHGLKHVRLPCPSLSP